MRPDIQRGPAVEPELLQRLQVLFKNVFCLWESCHRAVNTVFPQQMQRGVRRAVGEVGDVIGLRACKLKLRMEAGNLKHAFQLKLGQNSVSLFQKIVEIQKLTQALRSY